MRDNKIPVYLISFSSLLSIFFLSCNSTNTISKEQWNQMLEEQEKRINSLESSTALLKLDNEVSKKMLSSLQNDMQSQKEEMASLKKNSEILKRGLRSGIFEDFIDEKTNENQGPLAQSPKSLNSTMLPDLVNGRSGFIENPTTITPLSSEEKENSNPIGAKELLANAEIKMRKSEFKEGLIQLSELKKNYPNFEDNGRSYLLAAQAWLKLKEFDNVIPELRSFYLKYPTSADLAYAKLLEGQAEEGNGNFEKAASLYNEVISLSPQTTLAQSARNGMLRMRDQK